MGKCVTGGIERSGNAGWIRAVAIAAHTSAEGWLPYVADLYLIITASPAGKF